MTAPSTWSRISLVEQLGHVGAEIHRANNWEQHHDSASRNKALERAIDLVDHILSGAHFRCRRREIARLREVICGCYADSRPCDVSLVILNNYFLPLAMYARSRKAD